MSVFKLIPLEERIVLDASLAGVIYVDVNSTYNQSNPDAGSSWGKAYSDLNSAIGYSNGTAAVEQIWVADGIYKPGAARSDSFNIAADVSIYGGFQGFETSLGQRNPLVQQTILDGDLMGNDSSGIKTDNSWHVVTLSQTETVLLDGLTIRNGYADGGSSSDLLNSQGAGILSQFGSNLTLNLVTLKNNSAILEVSLASNGAAINFTGGSLQILNSNLLNNESTLTGGAMVTYFTDIYIVNSVFENNRALGPLGLDPYPSDPVGGLGFLFGGSVHITDSKFLNNSTTGAGGALFWVSFPGNEFIVKNSLFKNNSSGWDGGALLLVPGADAGNVIISDTVFDSNHARNAGGAVVVDSQNLLIERSSFLNNKAAMAGGVYLGNSIVSFGAPLSTQIVRESNFSNNVSTGEPIPENILDYLNYYGTFPPPDQPLIGGGAIVITDMAEVSVIKSNFVGNVAPSGGAISVAGYSLRLDFGGGPFEILTAGKASIQDSFFLNNRATLGDGGAISSKGWSLPDYPNYGPTETTITNSMFVNNSAAGNGGAVAGEHTTLSMSGSMLVSSRAHLYGGALSLIDSTGSILTNKFAGNFAGINGDHIYSNGSTINSASNAMYIIDSLTDWNKISQLDDDALNIV